MELETLLKEGILYYHKGFRAYKPKEIESIKTEILKMDVTSVPCLTMVNKFVEDNSNIRHYKDEGKNYYCIRKFCLDYILKEGVFAKLESYENRKKYDEDYVVLAMIRCYKHDPDQFWFMLQFLIFYVEALTTNVPKTLPSVKDQLLSLADSILSNLDYNKEDWKKGYPKYTGKLSFFKEDSKNPKISITDYRTLHYLSVFIKTHFEKADDPALDELHFKETREDIMIGYLGSKIITLRKQGDENKINEVKPTFLSVIDKGPFEITEDSSDAKTLAIFAYFFLHVVLGHNPLRNKGIIDFYPEYQPPMDPNTGFVPNPITMIVTTNRWVLFSKLIYRLNYYPTKEIDPYSYYYDVDTMGNNAPIKGMLHKNVENIDSILDDINPTRTIYI